MEGKEEGCQDGRFFYNSFLMFLSYALRSSTNKRENLSFLPPENSVRILTQSYSHQLAVDFLKKG